MINVSNIERFATHDGPGIRTTVFLKGCSLHCPWCANPETWDIRPVLMYDQRKCIHCQKCKEVCLNQAIDFPFQWTQEKCQLCHRCEEVCLEEAISFSGQRMEIQALCKEVLKDQAYYQQSNGGVTISGGEPFVQFDAFLAFVQALKKEGLHVAIETTGNYPVEYLKKALPSIDLFLMDCKHLDAKKLKEVTGGNAHRMDQNFRYLAKHCPEKVIVRMPVIPRFNDDVCKEVIDYAKEMGLKEVHLLPFHTLGKKKWEQLNRPFIYARDSMMPKDELQAYISYGKEIGIKVKIGG